MPGNFFFILSCVRTPITIKCGKKWTFATMLFVAICMRNGTFIKREKIVTILSQIIEWHNNFFRKKVPQKKISGSQPVEVCDAFNLNWIMYESSYQIRLTVRYLYSLWHLLHAQRRITNLEISRLVCCLFPQPRLSTITRPWLS